MSTSVSEVADKVEVTFSFLQPRHTRVPTSQCSGGGFQSALRRDGGTISPVFAGVPVNRLRRVPLEEARNDGAAAHLTQRHAEDDGGEVSVATLTVHTRYRHIHSFSQGSASQGNGSAAGTHSRVSSRERFSWDSVAWRDPAAELTHTLDPGKDYLRLGRAMSESIASVRDAEPRPRRHVRSLAAWDRSEVELCSKPKESEAVALKACDPLGSVTPIGRGEATLDVAFDTAPLGHQHSFSLPSQKDVISQQQQQQLHEQVEQQTQNCGNMGSVNCDDLMPLIDGDEGRMMTKGPIMTHVLVSFKKFYGMYYVPESERGSFDMGDLVTVESHAGENTGRAVCDLTTVMRDATLIPSNLAQLPHDVLYPEDLSLPLETIDASGKEMLQRLPRVIRRGMNKGKKRLYYARRRESEALGVCQRIIRERCLRMNVSGVEYQVDFKRITVFISGPSSGVSPPELVSFVQHLTGYLRGSAVSVMFSDESPDDLEVTRGITGGAFNIPYNEVMMRMQESAMAGPPPPPPPPLPTRTPPSPMLPQSVVGSAAAAAAAAAAATVTAAHQIQRGPRMYSESPVPPHLTPTMPMFAHTAAAAHGQMPMMIPSPNLAQLYGLPPVPWGAPFVMTPPPYLPHTHMAPSMSGRL